MIACSEKRLLFMAMRWNAFCYLSGLYGPNLDRQKCNDELTMDPKRIPKVFRQLRRAEGYIELNLPERALAELSCVDDQGPFAPAVAMLRGEALKTQGHHREAIEQLKRAIAMTPAPLNKRAWRSLSECYRECGALELAELADFVATEEISSAEPEALVTMTVVPLLLHRQH